MAKINKSFKNNISPVLNPAMQFIDTPDKPEKNEITLTQPKAPSNMPEGYKINPLYIETKSRRVQLLLQPSLFDKVKNQATATGISVNELIHSILEATFIEITE